MAVADVRGHPALLERLGQHLAQAYEGTRPAANPQYQGAPRGFKDEHLRQLHQYQCWVQFELRGVPGALLPPTMRAECARVMVTEAEDNTVNVSKLQQDVFIALKTSPLCRDRPAMVQDEYTIPELLALVDIAVPEARVAIEVTPPAPPAPSASRASDAAPQLLLCGLR